MTAAQLGQADFLAALQALLPRGLAWPREPDSVMTQALDGLASAFARLHARAGDLSEVETDPARTLELLTAWERAYGLPDVCVGEGQTIQERRAALLARIASSGGQSRAYFIAVAAALGFTITIQEFRPFRLGYSAFGDPLLDLEAAFRWRVVAPEVTTIFFRFGESAFGEPFQRASNAALECVLNRLKPAHTTLEFEYGS
ncbi:YmfQ family protein [Roseomonas sp. F4]